MMTEELLNKIHDELLNVEYEAKSIAKTEFKNGVVSACEAIRYAIVQDALDNNEDIKAIHKYVEMIKDVEKTFLNR